MNVSFLKKLGTGVLQGLQVATGIAPIVQTLLPGSGPVQTVAADLVAVGQVVANVEAIGQAMQVPGAKKAELAGPLVAQVVLQSSLVAGKKIANPDLFAKGCQELGGAIADIMNSISPDEVQVKKLN